MLSEEWCLLGCYAVVTPPVTLSLFGPNILINILFSNTLSLCSSLTVRDHFSRPYKTVGEYFISLQKYFLSRLPRLFGRFNPRLWFVLVALST
jgi:hypothetical protein